MWIPEGEFVMGSDAPLARPNEHPAHRVQRARLWMDRTAVTNAEFRAFVAATGYVTTAERPPSWETLKVQLAPGTPKPPDDELVPGAMVFVGTDRPVDLDDYSQWWRYVPGADWRHPQGPQSSIAGKDEHPVVQVSYEDALAYARWARKRLPTEAEWEFAARGGLAHATYAWGNEFAPQGRKMANVWEGSAEPFPVVRPESDAAVGTSRVCTFSPNGYGLCDMTGNTWQWVADWYRAADAAFAPDFGGLGARRSPGAERQLRPGGSRRAGERSETRHPRRLVLVQSGLLPELSAERATRQRSLYQHVAHRLSARRRWIREDELRCL